MTTGLQVTLRDRHKTFKAGNGDFVHDIRMSFTPTDSCFGFKATNSGVVPNEYEIAKLKEELTSLVTAGFFTMQIDKDGLGSASDDHLLLVQRDGTFDGANGNTRIQLGSPFSQVGPVMVVEGPENVFEFTGPVVVWAHGVGGGGGEKSNRIIACPSLNRVVATVS